MENINLYNPSFAMSIAVAGMPAMMAGQLSSIADFPALPLGSSANLRSSNISVPGDKVYMVEGVPHVKWTEKEVDIMSRIENLQFAVIGKFTYDITDMDELRKLIPQQCDIKALDEDPESNHTNILKASNHQKESTEMQNKHMESCKDWVVQNFGRQETLTQKEDDIISEKIHDENTTIQAVKLQNQDLSDSREVNLEKAEEGELVSQEVTDTGLEECNLNSVADIIVAFVALCSSSNNVEETDDVLTENNMSKAIIAIPQQDVDALPITMVSHAKQFNNQQLGSKKSNCIEYEHEEEVEVVDKHSQAIVECPGVIQLAENQLIQMESPNRVLHDIVSHNIEIGHSDSSDQEATLIARGLKEVDSNEYLWEVQLDAVLSPRLLKSATKGKKQCYNDKILPIMV
ncbi:hypothetical protein KY290_007644 [Solanum tuberosum]|uniref:Uncharacterized protein n=1 Tax=Solanum tuberosum TaxID=4113 RepID=A0ABQ7W833_SOLTU|nr:hypothetical protein KY290_007644 [Solanum tuberosum]